MSSGISAPAFPLLPLPQAHLSQHQYDNSQDLENSAARRKRRRIRVLKGRNFKGFIQKRLKFSRGRARIRDDRDSRFINNSLESFPAGYPRVAAFIDSDNDTLLFRRFGILHARSLLYKQVELTDLEARLNKLDQDDSSTPENRWRLSHSTHRRGGNQNKARKDLMDQIDSKLKSYDKLLLSDAQLCNLARPSTRTFLDFFDFIWTEYPFASEDQRFVYHRHDFIVLAETKDSWLTGVIYGLIRYLQYRFRKYRVVTNLDTDGQGDSDPDNAIHYNYSRINIAVRFFIALISVALPGVALLLIPIYMFLTLNISAETMATIVLIFAFVFATGLSLLTNAKKQEVFATTSAYCAVLVVFIGNIQQRQWSH